MPASLRFAALSGAFLMAAVAAVAQAPTPDRIVAERVLRLGGAVILAGQRTPIHDLDELPATDFRVQTLDLVGVSMGAWGLKDELSRLPPLPHLKELYLNGRLWYNQPTSLVADTIGLFSASTDLEKLVLSKPVQTYIPLEDPALARLATVPGLDGTAPAPDAAAGRCARAVYEAAVSRSQSQPLLRRSRPAPHRPHDRAREAVPHRHVHQRRGPQSPRRSHRPSPISRSMARASLTRVSPISPA